VHRTFNAGRAKGTGYLEDYADVANGLYELHVRYGRAAAGSSNRAGSPRSRSSCSRTDERGGFFLTPADGERLVARQKDLDDHPTPSGTR